MSTDAELVTRVMELSTAERADLARRLILSLEPPDLEADVAPAWEAEIERRLAQVDRGEVQLTDWRDSVNRVRQALHRPKAG